MATLTQLGAVTGRTLRPRYTGRINAMLPYLPNIYAQKQQNEYQDKLIDLENEKLAQTERLAKEETELTKKALKQQKKDTRTGNYLAALSTAGDLGIGMMKYKGWQNILDKMSGGTDVMGGTTGVGGSLIGSGLEDKGVGTGGMYSSDMGTGGSDVLGALKSGKTWTGAAVGSLAGKFLGGDDNWKGALIGAGVGGFTSWLSGGDLVNNIVGGLLGGIGGAIF